MDITKHGHYVWQIVILFRDYILGGALDRLIPNIEQKRSIKNFVRRIFSTLPNWLGKKTEHWIETDVISVSNLLSLTRPFSGLLLYIFVINSLGFVYNLSTLIWAALSDYADGYLARKMDQVTELGKKLDPACDKAFAIFAVAALWTQLSAWSVIPMIIIEVLLFVGGTFTGYLSRFFPNISIGANWCGKVKFNIQGLACFLVLCGAGFIGNLVLIAANIFALASLYLHLTNKNPTP